jgi:hypothetical protein
LNLWIFILEELIRRYKKTMEHVNWGPVNYAERYRAPASVSAEPQARRAIGGSTTIGMRLACGSMARRVRNDDYSSATYRDRTLKKEELLLAASVDV